VTKIANRFVKIKIRVPEGYLLVRMYDTTRPALLVLDADGRRIDSIKLLGAKPADVAARLKVALNAPAEERFILSGPDASKIGGQKAGDRWIVRAPQGKYTPAALKARGFTIHHPVPVKQTKAGPGTWFTRGETRYVARLLLREGENLEAKTFALPGVPKGGSGARVARAPFQVDGVVSVFPDIFAEWEIVVARKGIDWGKVRKAFARTGVTATER